MAYQKLAQALNDSVQMYTPDVLYPRECLIINVNEDQTLKIKANIGDNVYLDNVKYIGIPKVGAIGLFVPLNNNYNEGYCICYVENEEYLTENVIINNYGEFGETKVDEIDVDIEEISDDSENETSEETQTTINYDKRYSKINHTHEDTIGTIDELKTLIKNTKEGNILSLNKNFKNERYGNIILNKKIIIEGNGHTIENISFTCDSNEIELNNIIFFNITTNRVNGGVLQLNGQKISINNCIFYNNIINGTTVYEGGAISVNNSSVNTKITDCHFINNFCSNNGGAIRWVGNNGTLLNCSFIENVATYNGGAIKWLGTDGFIRNCLFKDNKATNGKDILTSDDGLLCIGNIFLNDDTITGTERVYDYITEYDKEEIEHQIYSSFGRNILPNTKDMVLSDRNIKVTYADELFRNNKVVYFDNETVSSTGYRDWYYKIPIGEFDYGDEFTLSFWIKGESSLQGKVKSYFYGNSGYIGNFVINTNGYDTDDNQNDGRVTFDITDKWKKCYVTWKIKDTGNLNVDKRVTIRIFDGYNIYLSSPKFERGNVYTDWTPNPNDSLYDRIPINASASNPNIDLNDYIESGVYYQPNNSNSQYVTNKPTNDNLAFSLFVEKQTDNGVKQTFTYYDYPKTSRMFVRIKHYSSNNWTKWEEIQFKGMIDGGSNLLNLASYFQSGGNEIQDGGLHNGHRAIHIDNLDKTSSQYTHIHWTLPLNFHNYNEIYTLSFWAKGTNGKNITTYFGGESGYVTVKRINTNSTVNNWESSFNDGATHFSLSDDWQHFYVTYKLNSTGDLTKRKQPIIRVWGETEAYISSPKLEKGYNVYDWTPSVLNAEPIYPNMDLNDFTMKGEYRCPLTAWVSKIENVPKNCQVAFNLKVEPTTDNGCIQTFSSYLPYKTLIFKRSLYNGDWSNWDMDITEPYICSVTDENYGTGTNGFGKLFKIHLNNAWYNSPISFEINQRGLHRPIKCYLKFNNENTKNPTIEYFTYDGENKDIYICNEEEEYYTVYVRKTENRDTIEVKNFNFNEKYSTIPQRARIYAINEQVSSVPYQSSSNYNSGNNDKKAVNVIKIESNNNVTLSNNLTINGNIAGKNDLTISRNATINNDLTIGKNTNVNNNLTVNGTLSIFHSYEKTNNYNGLDMHTNFPYPINPPMPITFDHWLIFGSSYDDIPYDWNGYFTLTVYCEMDITIAQDSNLNFETAYVNNNWRINYLGSYEHIPQYIESNNGNFVFNISKTNGKYKILINNNLIIDNINTLRTEIEFMSDSNGFVESDSVVNYTTTDAVNIIDLIYPIGSIYMSVNDISPENLFGGRWERLKDRFLLGSGDTYTGGSTGGSSTVALTQSQMPRHTHTQNSHSHKPSSTDLKFLVSDTNVAINGTARAWVSGSGSVHYVYSSEAGSGINEDSTTQSVTATNNYTGGTGSSASASNGSAHENMPPYLTVYMWKRIG